MICCAAEWRIPRILVLSTSQSGDTAAETASLGMGSREQSKEILATNPLYCPSQRRAKATVMEENPWGGKCPYLSSQPCRALLWMPPGCHRSPSHFWVSLLHGAKKGQRERRKSWTWKVKIEVMTPRVRKWPCPCQAELRRGHNLRLGENNWSHPKRWIGENIPISETTVEV